MDIKNHQIKLITNTEDQTYELIKDNLSKCKSFKFNVAFITWGGFQILAQTFDEISKRNVKGQILTTSYQDFTDPKIMKLFLNNFDTFEMKVVDTNTVDKNKVNDSFHPKGYIFEFEDYYRILIGSVNMTEKAMKTNVEWSLFLELKKDDPVLNDILDEFNYLWNHTQSLTQDIIDVYSQRYNKRKLLKLLNVQQEEKEKEITPNSLQVEALKELTLLRERGETKALVVAATGVGKTYLSAFDVQKFNPNKLLFIVHREEILKSARSTFEIVIKNKSTSIFKGSQKETNADMIFASEQTLHRNLELFKPDEFDYIIVDEAHHASANTYLKIINYFKPKFLLGMTATPERTDSGNIWELFGNNIAIDVRLKDAMQQDLITSFHYFGITDLNTIDLSDLDVDKDLDKIAKRLKVNERVDYVIKQMRLYQYDGDKMNCIAFCVNVDHAQYMCEEFNKRGIVSEYLIGSTPSEKRSEIIKRFQDDTDELSVIFVVDVFNEGVDIPKINLVLFLRPTNSPIIFLQQLGRGLRKNNNKKFLTVLDFIANHNKTYLIPYAFASFNNVIDEMNIQTMISENFKSFPELHIQFDSISQERILNSVSKINVYSEKWIKNEYLRFKNILKRVPKLMCDYLIEGAPDILKICKKYKTYLSFLSRIENEKEYYDLLRNEKFNFYIEYLTSLMPIYRINEFILVLEIIKNPNNSISFKEAQNIINLYTPNTSNWSINHTFKFLNHGFYLHDEEHIRIYKEKYKYKLFNIVDEYNNLIDIDNNDYRNHYLVIDNNFKEVISDSKYYEFILDIVEFGKAHFVKNYNLDQYVFPFLKFGQKYHKKWGLFINRSDWSFDAFEHATESVFCSKEYPDNYYLLINFDEDNNYDNRVLSRNYLFWYSPNDWTQNGNGKNNFINNINNNINLFIFIRRYKAINNVTQPFLYVGKARVIKFQNNKPIEFILELETPLNDELYYELRSKKEINSSKKTTDFKNKKDVK